MTAAIFGLWINWVVAVGVICLLASLMPLLPHVWLLPVTIAAYLLLQVLKYNQSKRRVPSCSRPLHEVSLIIIITAIISALIIMLLPATGSREFNGELFTRDTPLIGILISAPVSCVVCLCFLFNRYEPKNCRRCKMRYGNVIEFSFVGGLYRSEWRFQTRLLLFLSLALSVVDWGYYLIQYVNINLNRADYFYFLYLPEIIYVLSVIYLGGRYYSMWYYYCHNDEGNFVKRAGATTLRFLFICNDCILVDMRPTPAHYENGAVIKRFDTPVIIKTDYHEHESLAQAQMLFAEQTGIHDAEIRLIYSSPDPVTYQNIFHYFVFVKDREEVEKANIPGEWLTIGAIVQMLNQRLMSREMQSELMRIYDVAMTWKTYDDEGRRLYGIKHYKPTFRVRDIHKWDVNYDDEKWLQIYHLNQDKPFWRIRKFFSDLSQKRPLFRA